MSRLDVSLAHVLADPAYADSEQYDPSQDIDRLPVSIIPISSLRLGFFLRETGTDPAHVKLLADASNPNELPPILVQKSNLRIIDGMHRLEATRLRGEATIRARLVDCTDKAAFVLAVKSNTLHGLPLARADRIAGAKRILSWHPDWSDRAIGVATGLSAKTIAGIRRRSPDGVPQFAKRLGRDGKRHPLVNTEGRRRAADYMAARPEASLREVAREADVSLGTVHDVRARMRRGLDPVAGGRREASAEPKPSLASAPVAGRRAAAGVPAPPPRTWSIVSAKLANDPSLKYTEDGRNFIRWMTSHIVRGEEWKDFIDAIPAHWLNEVSLVAENASTEWRAFADHLKRRQNRAAV